MSLQALLFDVDGTLADTERDGHRVAFNQAFKRAGLDWEWTVTLYGQLLAVTGGKERMRYYLDRFNTAFVRPSDLDGFIAELHATKTLIYTDMLEQGAIPMRSGVRRLLHQARDTGLRLAVVTTTTPANVSALLRHSLAEDAESWFEVVAAGDIVAAKKPAPDIYLWTLDKLGLAPDQCMAFEDSENGVRSVLDAGLRSLLVTVNDYTRNQDFSGASLVLDQLGEPGQSCQVLAGELKSDTGLIDVATLQRLHESVYQD